MVLGDWHGARLDTRLRPGMMHCLNDWLAADQGRAAPLRAFTSSNCYHMSQLSHERDPGSPPPPDSNPGGRLPCPSGVVFDDLACGVVAGNLVACERDLAGQSRADVVLI